MNNTRKPILFLTLKIVKKRLKVVHKIVSQGYYNKSVKHIKNLKQRDQEQQLLLLQCWKSTN